MKPIMSLKSFAKQSTEIGVLTALVKLFQNPRRHVRGPFLHPHPSEKGGYPRKNPDAWNCNKEEARSVCLSGGVSLFSANEILGCKIKDRLDKVARQLYGDCLIGVSDGKGRRSALRLIKATIADARAA